MTIHKAKGLGFDVVIVPGMERPTQSDDQTLLRWIEQTRLVGPEEKEEYSMVVAPIGPNGQQGGIYKWIGQQEKRRQDEETKRLLYVAATRAREELHLLATASMKALKDGGFELTYGNKRSLLAVARPAVQEDFERALQAQQEEVTVSQQTELLFPVPERMIGLRRLPADWAAPVHSAVVDRAAEDDTERVERPRGSLVRRAFGTVVHALMEDLARLGEPVAVEGWRPRALALLRAAGLPRPEAEAQSAEVVRALQAVLRDPTGRWIVGARLEAQTEVAWSTWTDAGLRTLRGDRIFRAGPEPGSVGETHLWIVDYKTSRHGASGMDDFLAKEKAKYVQQLESYGEVLRKLPGNNLPVRLALYFPLVTRLVWW